VLQTIWPPHVRRPFATAPQLLDAVTHEIVTTPSPPVATDVEPVSPFFVQARPPKLLTELWESRGDPEWPQAS